MSSRKKTSRGKSESKTKAKPGARRITKSKSEEATKGEIANPRRVCDTCERKINRLYFSCLDCSIYDFCQQCIAEKNDEVFLGHSGIKHSPEHLLAFIGTQSQRMRFARASHAMHDCDKDDEENDVEEKKLPDGSKMQFPAKVKKPVLYLYGRPGQQFNVNVTLLDKQDQFGYVYPSPQTTTQHSIAWSAQIAKDGMLAVNENRVSSPYLFWDATWNSGKQLKPSIVVEKSRAESLLQQACQYSGLTPREMADFLVYWMPLIGKLPGNNVALLLSTRIADSTVAKLDITPQPHELLRFYIAIDKTNMPPTDSSNENILKTFDLTRIRQEGMKELVAVEWGGSVLCE